MLTKEVFVNKQHVTFRVLSYSLTMVFLLANSLDITSKLLFIFVLVHTFSLNIQAIPGSLQGLHQK